ncbi:MAG: DUF4136 domain-containing protein [Planctomycetota bacterium]|jgi:hypothetical protein
MRLTTCALAALLFVPLASGCSRYQTSSDYDPQQSFTLPATFMWLDDNGDGADQLTAKRIVNAIDATLAGTGLTHADHASATIGARFTLTSEERIDVSHTSFGVGYGQHRSRAAIHLHGHPSTYTVGIITLELSSQPSGDILWRGTVTTRLRELDSPEERSAEINAAISALLAPFPPPIASGP